ncbi:MAG: isochorismatase family protein [Sedimentisphaerales bacterium]|nr:isochorismatase family protein [Sedimentisphaerales bacterium]
MKTELIFWDVDTQYDFMMPDGTLYVPGAEQIVERVGEIRRFALANGFSIVADVDWHSTDDEEISETPDMHGTFPPHCLAGARGGERVGYLGDVPIDYVEIGAVDADALRRLAAKEQAHIVIRKKTLNVFDNPNTDALVDLVRPERVAVFGVALDCCVYYVLQGLSKHEGVRLSLLTDATRGLQTRPDEEIYRELRHLGVETTTFDELKRHLPCG